jgi:hypothetical protein
MARHCCLSDLAFDMEFDDEEVCYQTEKHVVVRSGSQICDRQISVISVMHSVWTESEHRSAHSTTGWSNECISLPNTTGKDIPVPPRPLSPGAHKVSFPATSGPLATSSFECVVDALFSFEASASKAKGDLENVQSCCPGICA